MGELVNSRDALVADLKNTSFAVYVFVGASHAKGWQVAEVAESLIPRFRVYRAEDPNVVREWLQDTGRSGLIFGTDDELKQTLSPSETEDLVTVLQAIKSAW